MKSSRTRQLSLTICEDASNTIRMDNHICLPDACIRNGFTEAAIFKKTSWGKLFGKNSGSVLYPVLFTSEVKQNQIYIPAEICRDLSLKTGQKIDITLDEIHDNEWVDINKITFVIQGIRNGMIRGGSINAQEFTEAVRGALTAFGDTYPLQNGQILVVPFHNVVVEIRVDGLEPDTFMVNPGGSNYFRLRESSQVKLINEAQQIKLVSPAVTLDESGQLIEVPLDFSASGFGGYKKQISQLIRSIFYTRAMKKSLLDAYGVTKHSKGVLLFGPPGTGKTLFAKTISGLFTKETVRVIEGPQLKNSFYGATQQNLADLFIDARKNPNKLFVYIFDEIDSLFATRGSDSSVSTSNNNDLVSRFLSILEGMESLDNVIVIGTTNRKELIDPALLRAGRLETHIYIGLPDELERLEILKCHTSKMTQTLAADVNLVAVAALAKNYSGAELARVVSVARGYALGKNFDAKHDKLVMRPDIKSINQLEKVNQQCFLRALNEVKPMFGSDDLSMKVRPEKFIFHNEQLMSIAANFQQSINCLYTGTGFNQVNYLISGAPGTGKTSLALQLGAQSKFTHVQVLTAEKLLGQPPLKQIEIIDEIFARARQSAEPSVIVLDTIEDIIEATPDYNQYNNRLRIKINELLKDAGILSNKLLVIGLTQNPDFLNRIGIGANFAECQTLSALNLDCRDEKKCGAQITAIAAGAGMLITNDLSEAERGLQFNLTIRDLLYQLHRFAAVTDAKKGLKLSEFLRSLPAKYHIPQQTEYRPAAIGLFKN